MPMGPVRRYHAQVQTIQNLNDAYFFHLYLPQMHIFHSNDIYFIYMYSFSLSFGYANSYNYENDAYIFAHLGFMERIFFFYPI